MVGPSHKERHVVQGTIPPNRHGRRFYLSDPGNLLNLDTIMKQSIPTARMVQLH